MFAFVSCFLFNTQYFFLVAVSHSIFNIQGDAAIYILRSAFGVNWSQNIRIIFAGDDLTDEDAMKALKGLAYNFRVVNSGLVQTMADHRFEKRIETFVLLM